MGRPKTVAQLQQQLTYAEKRAAYKPPTREPGTTTNRRPKITADYTATSPFLAAATKYTIQASENAIRWFGDGAVAGGLAELGLGQPGSSPAAPRGFHPNRIIVKIGGTPELVHARASGRPYIKYTRASGGNNQSTYTAPVSVVVAEGGAAAGAALATKVKGIFTTIETRLGNGYGEAMFEPERLLQTVSGTDQG